MAKDETGSIPIEDRFYDFVTRDFPDFRKETGERLTGVETQMKGVQGRLKKIEGGHGVIPPTNGAKTAFFRWLPWLITAVVGGAALGGAALAGGFTP